jgi:arylsulfatase A-like enzyme
MTRPISLLFAVFLGLLPGLALGASRPNLVFIVADDMGYADCGVQGCLDVPTPHIDSIAQTGIRFTEGYVTGAVCSPTRAALMTGRYHHRDGVHDWIPPGKPGLNPGVPLVADYLKKAGYRTALIGKWHLGEQPESHPNRRGFEEFYGFLGGGRSYFPDKPKKADAKENLYTQILRNEERVPLTEYATTAIGREAAAFVQRQKPEHPFFLYLAFNAVHTPLEAPEDLLAKFASIQDPKRRAYAGLLSAMDSSIGQVLEALRKIGAEENTVVCFLSDNGGPRTRNAPNGSVNAPLRGGKGQTWEGGIRVPFFLKWPARLKPGLYSKPVIQTDLTATALALAGVSAEAAWPMDGVSLLPFLEGSPAEPHSHLCWSYDGQWAVRKGNWKLTFAEPEKEKKEKGQASPVEALYDLSVDSSESRDLATQNSGRVEELRAIWQAWAKEVKVEKSAGSPKAH